jgi:hypothetical protein
MVAESKNKFPIIEPSELFISLSFNSVQLSDLEAYDLNCGIQNC